MINLKKEEYVWIKGYKGLSCNFYDGNFVFRNVYSIINNEYESKQPVKVYADMKDVLKDFPLGTKKNNKYFQVECLVLESEKDNPILLSKKIKFISEILPSDLISLYNLDNVLYSSLDYVDSDDKEAYYLNFNIKDVYVNRLVKLGYSESFSELLMSKCEKRYISFEKGEVITWNNNKAKGVYTLAKVLCDENVSKDLKVYLLMKEIEKEY
nr:MAG TPA: hypothetical protein [Caudoviricetes sp.]